MILDKIWHVQVVFTVCQVFVYLFIRVTLEIGQGIYNFFWCNFTTIL